MKIFIGADHRGFYLKEKVFEYLKKAGYSVEDIGGFEYDPNDDFPEFARVAVSKIRANEKDDPRAICLPARVFDKDEAEEEWKETIDIWLKTPFAAAPRFIRRNKQIDEV